MSLISLHESFEPEKGDITEHKDLFSGLSVPCVERWSSTRACGWWELTLCLPHSSLCEGVALGTMVSLSQASHGSRSAHIPLAHTPPRANNACPFYRPPQTVVFNGPANVNDGTILSAGSDSKVYISLATRAKTYKGLHQTKITSWELKVMAGQCGSDSLN